MNQETHLKRAIIDAINASGLARVWNSPAGVARVRRGYVHMAPRGTADISGHTRFGRAVYLEVKLPKGVVSDEQTAFIAEAKRSGCIAGIVRSVGEAIELLDPESDAHARESYVGKQ